MEERLDTPISDDGIKQGGIRQGWVRFWFTPADPIALHISRFLVGLLLLAWLLPFGSALGALFGLEGWMDTRAFSDAARLAESLRLPPEETLLVPGWSILYLCGTNATLLTVAYWASIAVLI